MNVSRRKCLSYLMLATLTGCQSSSMPRFSDLAFFDWPKSSARSQSPDDEQDDADEFKTSVKTPMVGDYTTVSGRHLIVLQGVGLVTGLNDTGGDPPVSPARTALLEDMKRRGVDQPNRLLMDRSTALVIVRAYLPPLVKQGEHFDVEVRVPGNDDTTSLNGGWLMETFLSEAQQVPGHGVMKGHTFARAEGPILVSTGEGDRESESALLRRGRVLGGGVSMKDRDMALLLRSDFRNVRNAAIVSTRIGERFYDYDRKGIKEPLAKGINDQKIELKILSRYKDNFPRYLQVIRKIAYRETEQARYVRMQLLKDKLNNPITSEDASIELEAIGRDAIPILKAGLQNPAMEVQFHSAVALAYLEQTDGLGVLAKAVRDEPAFRVFGLCAMSICEDAESSLKLQELLNEASAETRYGAFRALTTIDDDHPAVNGEDLHGGFKFHVLDTTGAPMIHVTTRKKAELVLFGAHQKLVTPIAVQAGEHIRLYAPAGSDTVTISRYQLGKPDQRLVVSTDLAEIIRTVAGEKFNASYPDVAQMLFQASKQKNLSSRLEIDKLPEAGRFYLRPQSGSAKAKKKKASVGHASDTPNLFESGKNDDDDGRENSSDRSAASANAGQNQTEPQGSNAESRPASGTASLADARKARADEDDDRPNALERARLEMKRLFGEEKDYATPPSSAKD